MRDFTRMNIGMRPTLELQRARRSLHPLRKNKSDVRFFRTLAGKAFDLQQTDSVQRIRLAAQFKFICRAAKYRILLSLSACGRHVQRVGIAYCSVASTLPLLSVIYAQDIFGNRVA